MNKNQRLGQRGYATVLRCLIDQPCTKQELMARCSIGNTAAGQILRSWHTMGLIRIDSWVVGSRMQWSPPRYAWGAGADAPFAARGSSGRIATVTGRAPSRPGAELILFASVLRALTEPLSAMELVAATGISPRIGRQLLAHMRSLRLVRVAAWVFRPEGGRAVPYYLFEPNGERDATRPPPRGRVESNRRYREASALKSSAHQIINALAANAGTFRQEEAA